MGDAARFPEAYRLPPLGLGADPDRGPGVDADAGRIATRRLGHRAQLAESGDRIIAWRIIQGHPTIAHLTTRSIVTSAWPPNQIGTLRRVGNGLIPASSIMWYLPAKVTCGSAHSASITSICSSERRPRLRKFSLRPTNSTGFQPTPTPRRNRPPHSTSSEAACLATSTAWRWARISTWVENSIFRVQAARKPNSTNGS